jgi:hypothetical protein
MSRWLSDRSLANSRVAVGEPPAASGGSDFRLIDRAHGRTSSYVSSDIGAIWPGRWHD